MIRLPATWFVLPIILSGCAQSGLRSQTASPPDPEAELLPVVVDGSASRPAEPRKMPEDEAFATVEAAVREGLRPSFEDLQRSPDVRRLLTEPMRRFESAFTTDDLVTFYVRDVSMKIPRELFTGMRAPGIVDGWLIIALKDRAAFLLSPNADMFVRGLRKIPDQLPGDTLPAAVVDALRPGFTTQFKEALAERLTFNSDYELKRFLYATDFQDVSVSRLGIVDLLSTWLFMQLKPLVQIDGAEYRVEPVETAYWHGLGYGALELNGQYIVDLYGAPHPISFTCVCRAERGCVPATLQPVMAATLAAVRPHASPTPGADMLAEARRIQRLPRGEYADGLLRAIILCAAQYDDAREQTLAFYAALPQTAWPARRVEEYELALHRQKAH